MTKLSNDEINQRLENLNGWYLKEQAIEKEWGFKDFKQAMKFINKVANIAEELNHHPEIFNAYSKVVLRFSTHDEGGITEKDFEIAQKIDLSK
jgi:4a-hydroxytetrahydrobiopterin dehydratase